MKPWNQKTDEEKHQSLIKEATEFLVRKGDIAGNEVISKTETVYEKLVKERITSENFRDYKLEVFGGFGEQNYSETDPYYKEVVECVNSWDFGRWVTRPKSMTWKDESGLLFGKNAFASCAAHWDDISAHGMSWMDYWIFFKNVCRDDLRIQEWYSPDLQELKNQTYDPDNYSKYYGMAAYQKIDNKGIYPNCNQNLNLQSWDQNFRLDQYQKGELLVFLFEQFQDRQLTIWRYPIRPVEGNVFGLYTAWVVEIKYIFLLQYRDKWKEQLAFGESSFDLCIAKKFHKWDDVKNFYEEMRHLDLLQFQDFGVMSSSNKTRKIKNVRSSEHNFFEYGKISNGDSGIHWKSVGEAFEWICHICGEQTERKGGTHLIRHGCTVDHIVPQSKGGANTWNNVRPAHWECNIRKNNRL